MVAAKRSALVASPCEHCGSPGSRDDATLRCDCGSLLARFVGGKLELKCRRCKRTVMVSVEDVLDGGPD